MIELQAAVSAGGGNTPHSDVTVTCAVSARSPGLSVHRSALYLSHADKLPRSVTTLSDLPYRIRPVNRHYSHRDVIISGPQIASRHSFSNPPARPP